MQNEKKELTDVVIGTVTNLNSSLGFTSGQIVKSGHTVNFKLTFRVKSGFSCLPQTKICDLQWGSVNDYQPAIRVAGPGADVQSHYINTSYIYGKELRLGIGDYSGITEGNYVTIAGTYITND